jgi:hypothetical protein
VLQCGGAAVKKIVLQLTRKVEVKAKEEAYT